MAKKRRMIEKKVIIEKTTIRKLPAKKRRTKSKKRTANPRDAGINKKLAENFVSLQRVLIDVSVKLDNLAKEISQLLNLFETAGKTLAEKEVKIAKESRENKEILDRLDNLFEQNRVIAKGLTLVHEGAPEAPMFSQQQRIPKPNPQMTGQNTSGYQRSISARYPEEDQFPEG